LHDLPANEKTASQLGVSTDMIREYAKAREIDNQLKHINMAGVRAAKIVKNMLSFARKGESAKTYANLPELFDKTIELAQSDYDLKKNFDFKEVVFNINCDTGFPKVFCDPSKIQQVFFNIIKNGAEAMYDFKNQSSQKPTFDIRFASDGEEATIEMENNGPGIEEPVRKRIFEPFFTTKGPSKGTGLGLSVSYFIITEDHRGQMSVSSTPGNNTMFTIKLPIDKK